MKHIITFFLVVTFFVACSNDKPKPPKPKFDPVLESSKIKLFKQSLPIKKEVLQKAYKKITPKIGLSNLTDFKGTRFKDEFVFNEDNLPFVEYRFDKPYIIKKIHLLKSGFVVDGNDKGSNIKKYELLFLDAKHTPAYNSELEDDSTYIDNFDNIQAQGFILKARSVYFKKGEKISAEDIIASFDSRVEVEVIDTDYIFDIVETVLSERDASVSNEELLKTIALMNRELFKRLRLQRSDFNLPPESVMYLPEDADMNYAVANTKNIYETGKYKTLKGRYKIYIFSDEVDFKEQEKIRLKKHKIRSEKSNRNLKTTEELPEHQDFIDFSETK